MRAGLIILFNIIIFILSIDALLYFNLRKFKASKKFSTLFNLIYWLTPVAFITSFIYLFIINKGNIDERGYYIFTLLNGLFLLMYIPKAAYLTYALFYWMVIKTISFFSWRKKSGTLKYEKRASKITRAAFLGKVGLIVAGAPFLSLLYGMAKGRFNFHVKHVELKFKNLPKAFDGLKVAQISDIHLGNFNKEYHRLHEVTELINHETPDLILMTGDLVNNFASETDGWETVFSKMKAPMGKFSILGNHDYGDYSRWKSLHAKKRNFEDILASHKRFGFQLLRNESLDISRRGQNIHLLGVENWGKPPFPQYGDLAKAMKGSKPEDFNILLSHDPDHWEEEVKGKNVALTLSGHTHGMQFGVKFRNSTWSPAQWKYKYWDGLYQAKDQYLYVNRGLGFIGLPMRVGMPPEITMFTLRSL